MESIKIKDLRAAFILWEMDVRANPDGFQSEDEQRSEPLEQAADGYISGLLVCREGDCCRGVTDG
ncbi:hypothetical protein [Burkholderia pseudomallei]|uniref:hypothetical protein n=1 Tax=Burkholderia pseudomallei TaxID=28450 RepID=UPI000A19FD79|nr:hypothetical protein [Burkholderia pseudomallei]ARK86056.1 hypothetical protein BOC42_00360 [Burkholderia pseudomallei]